MLAWPTLFALVTLPTRASAAPGAPARTSLARNFSARNFSARNFSARTFTARHALAGLARGRYAVGVRRLVAALAILPVLLLLAPPASAQEGDAYVRDAQGVPIRNSNVGDAKIGNLCWRTGYWTPAQAVAACEPDLVPVAPSSTCCGLPVPVPDKEDIFVSEHPQKFTITADVFFDFDKSVLKPQGKAALDEMLGKLNSVRLELIIAVGHTDGIGGDAYNNKLSVRRAEAVKAYLVNHGVAPDRVYVEGKGKREPVADNRRAEGRAQNRRVEIEVVGTSK